VTACKEDVPTTGKHLEAYLLMFQAIKLCAHSLNATIEGSIGKLQVVHFALKIFVLGQNFLK
jgi:hypothetical protein